MRLDNIVLSLLHRHREDLRPTGATFALPASPSPSPFPASPRSRPRPASLRSMSGNAAALSRPWTPNLPMTPTGGTFHQDHGSSVPSSPLLIPQAITIGNGSPRASPSLWHRSISNSTSIAATSNPWTNSNPITAPSPFFTPLGPPGDTIGSPPKSTTSHTDSNVMGTSTSTQNSRPSSPSNVAIDSPRLNVAALEFKPRTTPQLTSSQHNTPQISAPWLVEEAELAAVKTSDDSDEDEFSPFASQGAGGVPVPGSSSSSSTSSSRLVTGRARPISGTSGHSSIQSLTTAESVSGSYHDSTTSTSLESGDDQRGASKWADLSREDDMEGVTMTPFDFLSSILSSSQVGASSWTNEQLEEALEMNNWDIDATLSTIMESGGMPTIASSTKSKSPGLLNRTTSGLSIASPSTGRSGVSLVSRDSFNSQRAGISTPGPSSTTITSSSPLDRVGNQSFSTTLASQQLQQGGAVGPGRVCRYFLAGECRRADCRFSHDLNRAICRFWMKGQCLNGEGCSFLHDMSIVDKLTNRLSSTSLPGSTTFTSSAEVETPPNEEFPELTMMAPTGPKAQRIKGNGNMTPGSVNLNDASRTRWAQALQKRANTPLSTLAKNTPTGPKNSNGGSSGTRRSSAAASRIPLHAPLLLPTLSTGKDASQSYVAYRELATSLSNKRNKYLARAAEAWKRGDGSEARKWSKEGQDVNKMLQDESRIASRAMLKERHGDLQKRLLEDSSGTRGLVDPSTEEKGSRGWRGKLMGDRLGICLGIVPRMQSKNANTMTLSLEERMEVLLDLHSMHSTEAIEVVEEFLINLEKENFRGLALLAVGLGKHTSQETDKRRVGLSLGVKGFLSSWNYPFSEQNGVIIVDPLSHL